MTKYRIEMTLPDDLDPSELLERMQGIAMELHEEAQGDDDPDIDEDEVVDAVSVQVV